MTRRFTFLWPAVGGMWLLIACDTAPPAAQRAPQTRPAETQPAPMAPSPPATATAPATTQPATAEVAASQPMEPELPEYLTIVTKTAPREPARIDVVEASGRRLQLQTANVERLRIDRRKAPLTAHRSVALILDGQGLEWRADSDVSEFERSRNGLWVPVKPAR